jgi:hypothetical protein
MLTLDYKDDKFTLTGSTGVALAPMIREEWKFLEAMSETNFYRCPLCNRNSINTGGQLISLTTTTQERLGAKKLSVLGRYVTCLSCRHYAIKIYHKLNTLYFSDVKWF